MGSIRPSTAVLCALACACGSAPPPSLPPPATLLVQHTLLAGVDNRENSPQHVLVAMHAVRRPIAGPSVDAAAATITAQVGLPFRGASGQPPGAAWLVGDAARAAVADLAQTDGAARLLATASAYPAVDLVASVRADSAEGPALRLQRGADGGVHLRIGAGRATDGTALTEAHLAAPLPSDGPAVLFAPATGGGGAGYAYVLTLAATDPADAARARADAAPAAPPAAGFPRRWRIAFQSVGQHNRRPPLLEIARTLGADRCRDALLVADEALLIEFTERLARELTPAAADSPWPFERALWRSLLPRLERDELPDALHAHCLRQLGAMADDTGALRAALDASADGAAFVRALREDNLGALSDHDAAWRTRGLDWLRRQGVAVPGFDPLAGDDERRAALREFFAAEGAAEAVR